MIQKEEGRGKKEEVAYNAPVPVLLPHQETII